MTTPVLTKPIGRLLFEAYRRNQQFIDRNDERELSRPLELRWLGLGTAAAYRPMLDADLMTWAAAVPQVRCMGWLRLTAKGVELYQQHLSSLEAAFADYCQQTGYSGSLLSQYQLAGGLDTSPQECG